MTARGFENILSSTQ